MFRRTNLSAFDFFLISVLAFASVIMAIYLYQSIIPIQAAIFQSPVQTDKPQYRLGEVVVGTFYGTIYTAVRPNIGRRLACDHQGQPLTDFQSPVSIPGPIFGRRSSITQLADSALKVGGTITPDTNCVIQFTSTYEYPRIVGTPRVVQVSYYTTKFDIIAGAAAAPVAPTASVSDPSLEVEQSAIATAGTRPAASPALTQAPGATAEPKPAPGQPSLLQRIVETVTGIL